MWRLCVNVTSYYEHGTAFCKLLMLIQTGVLLPGQIVSLLPWKRTGQKKQLPPHSFSVKVQAHLGLRKIFDRCDIFYAAHSLYVVAKQPAPHKDITSSNLTSLIIMWLLFGMFIITFIRSSQVIECRLVVPQMIEPGCRN